MPYDWGPRYIVPTEVIKTYSGQVLLREDYDRELLAKELEELKLPGNISMVNNPWYYRRKGGQSWIKIGESANQADNFSVRWDTRNLANGQYEVLGMMHVSVKQENTEYTIARQNVVEINVNN